MFVIEETSRIIFGPVGSEPGVSTDCPQLAPLPHPLGAPHPMLPPPAPLLALARDSRVITWDVSAPPSLTLRPRNEARNPT